MCERQQADHGAAGLLLALLGQQRLEGAGISAAREQLIAIDQIEQRHRLLAQRMDDVMIVDDVAVLAAGLGRPTTPQGQQLRRAEEAFEPVVVEVNIQTVADQPRRNAVEDAPQDEAAARRDENASLLIVGRSSIGQRLERGALDLDALAVPGVAPPDHLVDEAAVGGEILEVARAAQQQLVVKRPLEVSVGALDRAVLVRDAAIVARRRHAVMGAQLLVAPRQVLLGIAIEVAERRRQAVAAMLFRHAAQRPQRVLQAFGQRHEALAAEHHMGMLEARERQPEVVEPVLERLARDRDAEPAHVGEVRQAHPARRMLLAEDHIPVGAVESPPSGDAALQGPAHPRGDLGMATADLLEDRHRADARGGLQHRHDLALPHPGERVGTPPPTGRLLLRRQPRIGFDPIGGGGAEPGLRGSDGGGIGLTGLHVQPRLAVGDVSARQALILLVMKNQMLRPTAPTARRTLIPWGKRAAGGSLTTVGLRPPSVSLPPAPFSS